MNVHEIAGLLSYFGSAWPKMELPDDTADIWAMELQDVNADYAREAAKNLVRTAKFFPSIAEFLEECRNVAQGHRVKPFAAIPASTSKRTIPHEEIAQLRSQLKDWSARGHNHKGPAPCPVCHPNARQEPA